VAFCSKTNDTVFMLIFSLLLSAAALAVPNYVAERDPPAPEARKQYRLILRTPDRACDTWHKVEPQLPKEDLIVNSTKKDEAGKGCRFLWVITPAETPGPVTFSLDSLRGGKENFELPAPANYTPPKPVDNSHSPFMHVPGVADENGNVPTSQDIKGKVILPNANPGTGR
jgi:hypothetical protein